ncbi:MAG: ABC transporter ATP-binding protein [Bacteroidetes bacterium]|nr:ABC transporter ATP-binding protein [Bacteroidota bacterium]
MLSIHDIAHVYTGDSGTLTTALRGVSFSAASGQVTALVGPNGSGKTTLFRLINGLLPLQQGRIELHHGPVRNARIGVVFQSPSLDPYLTVFENIRHHVLLYGRTVRRPQLPVRLLNMLDLSDKLDTRTRELSGGFQRRVELAKVLLTEPDLLILDEPFSGLDLTAREAFFSLLREVTIERELTTLLITHVLSIATLCDRVVLLENGNCIADDFPEHLLEDFGRTVVEIVSADAARLFDRLRRHFGGDVLRLREDTVLLKNVGLGDVISLVDVNDASIKDMQARRPGLEDFFVLRTGQYVEEREEDLLAA